MAQIDSILCPVDFSESSANAYEYARSLAWHYNAKLFLQHVLYPLHGNFAAFGTSTDFYEKLCCELRAETEEKLDWFAREHGRRDIQPQCIVQDGVVMDMILCQAEAQKVNLIVMGTHGLRGFDRLMLGSVTEKVLRRARCPVLAVRKPLHHAASAARDHEPVHIRKIVLCTDFSDHAHRASEYALSMAREYGAELTLLHVLEHFHDASELERVTAEAQEQLQRSVPAHHAGCVIKTVVRIGKPYQQIIQFAMETQADLAIMGVRGRGALDTALFGSTTYRVLQLGPCPVLAVHI